MSVWQLTSTDSEDGLSRSMVRPCSHNHDRSDAEASLGVDPLIRDGPNAVIAAMAIEAKAMATGLLNRSLK